MTAPVKRWSCAWRASRSRRENQSYSGRRKLKVRFFLVAWAVQRLHQDEQSLFLRTYARRAAGYRANDLCPCERVVEQHPQRRNDPGRPRAADLSRDEKVVLIGYSKGVPDILQALVEHPVIVGKVAAVVSIAGSRRFAAYRFHRRAAKEDHENNPIVDCPHGVGTRSRAFSVRPGRSGCRRTGCRPSVKVFRSSTSQKREDISTALQPSYDSLAQIDPRNDSQLIFYDQLIPGMHAPRICQGRSLGGRHPLFSGQSCACPDRQKRIPPRGPPGIDHSIRGRKAVGHRLKPRKGGSG